MIWLGLLAFGVCVAALAQLGEHFTKVRSWVYMFIILAVVAVIVLLRKGYS